MHSGFLVNWNAKSVDLVVSDSPSVVRYPVAAVAFNGVDVPTFDLFDNAYVICDPILTVGFDLIPIEVDDVAGIWNVAAVLPFVSLSPVNTEEELDMLLAHVLGDDGGGADD